MENRQRIFRGIVGAYLGYLGFKLVRDVVANEPGAKMYFAVIGIAFIGIGVSLIIWIIRDMLKERNENKDKDDTKEE